MKTLAVLLGFLGAFYAGTYVGREKQTDMYAYDLWEAQTRAHYWQEKHSELNSEISFVRKMCE